MNPWSVNLSFLKVSVLAASRTDIRRILLPKANEKDLKEVPEQMRDELMFVWVESVSRAMGEALLQSLPALTTVGESSKSQETLCPN